ncbi:primosomal protein N' (replication factor Y) - superfamily II helicase [Paroceanicella profunda]|uniref:Primosomal protein N' (Replication factor Y)-superfamily II helicase n=1 Tax=Paroceanicella profunda TaxID=2579971 RepID=A0A5B8FT98_9RHOB|nr:primosomal protein N' (replication factor Y) - superfamily II helicase [Paroceanicella profunda]QDL90554.1 primosomal protein N' (replication factor Y) - superfamily II helicase [Paroceanicella profunda]
MDGPSEHRFPCPTCGSDMRYAPAQDLLTCDHCGHTEDMHAEGGPWGSPVIAELDFRAALAGALDTQEMEESRTVTCQSCGAEFEFAPDTHAAECPFCASPVVTDTGANRHIKPRGVLPFLLDEAQARAAMNRWLGKLWFAPSGLAQYARAGRAMQGIYTPYWTYDARTDSSYTGQRGDAYYVTRPMTVMRDGKPVTVMRQERRIRWRPASGRVNRVFDDVLVLASRSLETDEAEGLAPWDLSALEPYRPEFLAGFRAEAYTVPLDEGFAEARQVIDRTIQRDVRFDIGGDEQRIQSIDTRIDAITFKHILLPVWTAAYRYRGTSYRFVVNGRTGQVRGQRPWSAWKIAAAVAAGLAVAAVIGFLVASGR